MNGLEEKHKGVMTCEIRDAFDEKSKAEIKELGFKTHGMVFYDAEGKILKQMDGHMMTEQEINSAVTQVLGM